MPLGAVRPSASAETLISKKEQAMTTTRDILLAIVMLIAITVLSFRYDLALAEGPSPAGKSALVAKTEPPRSRHVDLAICLDTSNSMDGLIESAKQKLWAVVNDLSMAEPKPILRVALYQYGNDNLSSSNNGWVQQVSGLTDDLDAIYGKLVALRTNGGSEYVARVIQAAANELDWSQDVRPMRIIVVAGNEAATQDPNFKLQDVCKSAAERGITINTIFCGDEAEGANTGWADAARWADGMYAGINSDKGTIVIDTKYDKQLLELGEKLNKTYVPFGSAGSVGESSQKKQDVHAAQVSTPAAADRVATKASGLYQNSKWDLVDASKQKNFDLSKVPERDLPAEMQKLKLEERKALLEKQAKEREVLQLQINALNASRGKAIQDEKVRLGIDDGAGLDTNLNNMIRSQATKNGFEYKKN